MVAKKHFTNARRTLLVRSMNGGVRGEQANDELAELSSHYDNATSAIMNLVSLYSSTHEEKRMEVTLREAELLEEQFTTATESILEDVRGQVRSYAEETDYLGVSQRPHPVQARRKLASEVGYGYSGPAASTMPSWAGARSYLHAHGRSSVETSESTAARGLAYDYGYHGYTYEPTSRSAGVEQATVADQHRGTEYGLAEVSENKYKYKAVSESGPKVTMGTDELRPETPLVHRALTPSKTQVSASRAVSGSPLSAAVAQVGGSGAPAAATLESGATGHFDSANRATSGPPLSAAVPQMSASSAPHASDPESAPVPATLFSATGRPPGSEPATLFSAIGRPPGSGPVHASEIQTSADSAQPVTSALAAGSAPWGLISANSANGTGAISMTSNLPVSPAETLALQIASANSANRMRPEMPASQQTVSGSSAIDRLPGSFVPATLFSAIGRPPGSASATLFQQSVDTRHTTTRSPVITSASRQWAGASGVVGVHTVPAASLWSPPAPRAMGLQPAGSTAAPVPVPSLAPGQTRHQQPSDEIFRRLKTIQIPTFTGNKRAYRAWRAAFMACVGQTSSSPEVKLLHLKQYLGGEALVAIESLGYSAHAYEAAVNRLDRKFGGEQRQTNLQFEEVESFPALRTGRPGDLQRFADLLDVLIVNMADAGTEYELGDGLLFRQLQNKLPMPMLTQFNRWRHNNTKPSSVPTLLEWVTLEAEFATGAAEMAHGVSSVDGHHAAALPTKPAPARSRPAFGGSSGAHASSFLVSGQSAAKIQCAVCDAPHHTWSCDIFKSESPSRRWETAKKKGLCYRCLGTGHRGTSCTRNRKCGVSGCSQTHHQLLHDRQPQQKRNLPEAAMSSDVASSSAPTASISTRGATTPAIEPASINCSIQACNITEGEPDLGEDRPRGVPSVSLRILPVSLVHEGERIQVNAMLDDCSTTIYITTAAAGQLRVAGRPQQASVSLLSGLTETFVTTPVNITVESADGTFQSKLTALTIESIASNLKAFDWANAAAQWDHLRDVPFTALTEESVDLLIGSDHSELHSCWEEVIGKPGEPLARRTP